MDSVNSVKLVYSAASVQSCRSIRWGGSDQFRCVSHTKLLGRVRSTRSPELLRSSQSVWSGTFFRSVDQLVTSAGLVRRAGRFGPVGSVTPVGFGQWFGRSLGLVVSVRPHWSGCGRSGYKLY